MITRLLRLTTAVLLGLILWVSITSIALAQNPTPSDDDVNAIAKEMYCPVCENIPLDVCPTTACAQWRDLIREKLAAGWDEQQIKQYFATQYGDRVLSQPPARGLNWLVYVLPPMIFVAGIFLVYRTIRGSRRPAKEALAPAPTVEDADPYLSQIEEELEHHRKQGA